MISLRKIKGQRPWSCHKIFKTMQVIFLGYHRELKTCIYCDEVFFNTIKKNLRSSIIQEGVFIQRKMHTKFCPVY